MSVVNKNMTQNREISSISSKMGFSSKTMREYVKRRLILDDSTMEGNWEIMCRVALSNRIDEGLKNLVISFWIDNTFSYTKKFARGIEIVRCKHNIKKEKIF